MSFDLAAAVDLRFQGEETTIAKDLKLNLKRLSLEGGLDSKESALTLLALATSEENRELQSLAREWLQAQEVPEIEIQEAAETAAIMGMLNIYYRFRHLVSENGALRPEYQQAGLRMTSLAKPVLGKLTFEMLAFSVSVLNGCASCIQSHEKVLLEGNIGLDKIHTLARLAAVVKGLKALQSARNK